MKCDTELTISSSAQDYQKVIFKKVGNTLRCTALLYFSSLILHLGYRSCFLKLEIIEGEILSAIFLN